jgi:hypothetical protein
VAFKSGRPMYAIILVALSTLFMAATFLPFLYSILFPNENIERFVTALKDGGEAPLDADSVVEQTKAVAGSLTRAIQIGAYFEMGLGFHLSGSRAPQHTHTSQATYIAWFQRLPKPLLVSVTFYANDEGKKAYGLNEVALLTLVRGYGVPVALFAASLFLARRRNPPGAAA